MRLPGIVGLRIVLAAVLAAVALTACSAAPHPKTAAPTTYYLALGDSLSQGVQPNAAGTSVETGDGYPDQVYAVLRRTHPTLKLVKLGCPGETTTTMMHGGICRYAGGSQLAAAVAFLHAHRGRVLLVTIDIGANDVEHCDSLSGLEKLGSCIGTAIPDTVTNVATIMARLKVAAGPGVRIVGMNYYLPALAEWRDGLTGHLIAWVAEQLTATFNDRLDQVYAKAGIKVADVFGAFDTSDFAATPATAGASGLPRNVALLCRWTWECTAPPRGPNQHANQAGYQVIARAFLQAAGLG